MEKHFSVANAKLQAIDKIAHSLQQALADFKVLFHKLHNYYYFLPNYPTNSEGFFILDDPFIKADPYRLKKQLQMVREMAYEEGWQIIYFTAKGEVEEALREEKEKGEITYFKIEDFSHEEE